MGNSLGTKKELPCPAETLQNEGGRSFEHRPTKRVKKTTEILEDLIYNHNLLAQKLESIEGRISVLESTKQEKERDKKGRFVKAKDRSEDFSTLVLPSFQETPKNPRGRPPKDKNMELRKIDGKNPYELSRERMTLLVDGLNLIREVKQVGQDENEEKPVHETPSFAHRSTGNQEFPWRRTDGGKPILKNSFLERHSEGTSVALQTFLSNLKNQQTTNPNEMQETEI